MFTINILYLAVSVSNFRVSFCVTVKSRVLLSVREEEEVKGPAYYSPQQRSFCLRDYIKQWFHSAPVDKEAEQEASPELAGAPEQPHIPKVEVLDVELENNQTGEGRSHGSSSQSDSRRIEEQASMHPDISVMAQTRQTMDTSAWGCTEFAP